MLKCLALGAGHGPMLVVGGVVAGAATGGVGSRGRSGRAAVACGVMRHLVKCGGRIQFGQVGDVARQFVGSAAVSLARRARNFFFWVLPGVWTAPLVSLS